MPWRCALLAEVRSLRQNICTPEGVSPPLAPSHLTQMMANAFIATSRWVRYHTLSISFNLDFHSVLRPCWACTDAVQTWPHLACMRWLQAWQVRCSCCHARVISYIAYSGLRTLFPRMGRTCRGRPLVTVLLQTRMRQRRSSDCRTRISRLAFCVASRVAVNLVKLLRRRRDGSRGAWWGSWWSGRLVIYSLS